MAAVFSWYNQQYASWNRMRRLHVPPFLARTDTRTSRTATAIHTETVTGAPGDVVINMNEIVPQSAEKKDNKDTLFGPSVGVTNNTPDWCSGFKENDDNDDEKKDFIDELTPDVVKEWIRRSKDPSEPTTTLQALVNLKRPSIRLSPLVAHPDSEDHHQHQQHGLEFEFDCDAPRCSISLYAIGVPAHLGEDNEKDITENSSPAAANSDYLHLFETSMNGGFSQKLALADGAILELARLEAAGRAYREERNKAAASAKEELAGGGGGGKEGAQSSSSSTPENADSQNDHSHENHKRRLTFFKKKGHSQTANQGQGSGSRAAAQPAVATAGPALAVVDTEASVTPGLSQQNQNTLATFFAGGEAERIKRKREEEETGVRLAIRLSARDKEGKVLGVRNEQITYLHIVRHGPLPATTSPSATGTESSGAASSTSNSSEGGGGARQSKDQERNAKHEGEDSEKEDTRPWVVHVVKREARIGLHTFQLHEIYGLTSHSTATPSSDHAPVSAPSPATTNSTEHTYPPPPVTGGGTTGHDNADEDDAASECLLCLSSPREVVLLPCRHLVACRECAVNMVEFGAGGTVTQPEAETGTNNNGTGDANGNASTGDGAAGAAGDNATAAPAPAPAPAPTARRKRKAKGWFCPVCRQPYTSLLRITTTPPPLQTGYGASSEGAEAGTGADAKRISVTSSLEPEHPEHLERPMANGDSTSETPVESGTARGGTLARMLSALGSGGANTNSGGGGNGGETAVSSQTRDLERGV